MLHLVQLCELDFEDWLRDRSIVQSVFASYLHAFYPGWRIESFCCGKKRTFLDYSNSIWSSTLSSVSSGAEVQTTPTYNKNQILTSHKLNPPSSDRRVIVRRLALILKKASLVSVQWAKFMIEVPLNRKIVLISWQFILQMREKKKQKVDGDRITKDVTKPWRATDYRQITNYFKGSATQVFIQSSKC